MPKPDLTPSEVGTLHATLAIAEHAAALAASRRAALASVTSPHDRAYLTAYAERCEAVVERAKAAQERA